MKWYGGGLLEQAHTMGNTKKYLKPRKFAKTK